MEIRIRDLLSNLQPKQVDNSTKIRLGSAGDGGYVIMDHSNLTNTVLYSYGIEENDSFDQHYHNKYGALVRQYDFSIPATTVRDGFTFTREGISHEKTENCDTFAEHIIKNGDTDKRIFLKLDVEGAEWLTLLHMPEYLLKQCNQIVIELHDLSCLGKSTDYPAIDLEQKVAVMEKMNKLFHLWHVHANNHASVHIIDGYKVPDVIEVTFINKELHEGGRPSEEIFPTKYDQACYVRMQDHTLDYWPFYPKSEIVAEKKPFLERKLARLRRNLSTRKWQHISKKGHK